MLGLAQHARLRMRQRDITESEIEDALTHASDRYPSEDAPNRLVVLGTTENGRRLKVVVSVEDQQYIITVADRDDER